MPCDDCSRTESCPPCPQEPEESLDALCYCGHQRRRHHEPPGAQCVACPGDEERSWRHEFAPEPPMTPEEEEAAPEDNSKAICGRCFGDHAMGSCETEPAPPQPERRSPYAVDYSAGGHGFQLLVPGDATVVAVDGALVLRHESFPVLGISAVTPLKKED